MPKEEKPVKSQAQNTGPDAPPVHEADSYGQQGKVRDAKYPDEKGSTETVAQVQEVE
jgi:hypothetical protein